MYVSHTCKEQRFTVNTIHLLNQLAETHIMPGTIWYNSGCNTSPKHTQISISKIPKAKSGMPKQKTGKNNIWQK